MTPPTGIAPREWSLPLTAASGRLPAAQWHDFAARQAIEVAGPLLQHRPLGIGATPTRPKRLVCKRGG